MRISPHFLTGSIIYSYRSYDISQEVSIMAKPIEIGLVLEGDDAKKFYSYMDNPTITNKGRELIREAIRLSKSQPCE